MDEYVSKHLGDILIAIDEIDLRDDISILDNSTENDPNKELGFKTPKPIWKSKPHILVIVLLLFIIIQMARLHLY